MAEYLAIDGWGDFQKYRGKRAGFILDATDQNEKPKLSGLSHFTRSVLQELRRARGRSGKNIPYDIDHIARATHTIGTDRPHLQHALSTLISRGILLVTNQQDDIFKSVEKEIENKKEKEKKPSAAPRGERPTDPRFHHCVDILHRYWDKFIRGKLTFELWFGAIGGKQLKNSLNRHKALTVEDFTRCVANRARSPGVDHNQPAYEWLGHVLDWAGGPKANGRGQAGQVSKADSREQRIVDSAVRAAAAGAGAGAGSNPLALPGNGRT